MHLVLLCISLFLLYYWSCAKNDFDDFNTFVILKFHTRNYVHWYKFVLCLFYTNVLLCSLSLIIMKWKKRYLCIYLHPFNIGLNLVYIIMVCALWSNEWALVFKSLHFYYLYVHIFLSIFTLVVVSKLYHIDKFCYKLIFSMTFISSLLILAYIYQPPCVINGPLPAKPKIIGHRGAQYITPENTILSYHNAILFCDTHFENISSLVAFETDVQISYDGIPFLLHDSFLYRTTDIRSLFPKLFKKAAYFFNFTRQLQRLNAGSWFIREDPFYSVKYVRKHYNVSQLSNQSLPHFSHFLEMANTYGKNVIFDLKFPPECLEKDVHSLALDTQSNLLDIENISKLIHITNNVGYWDWNNISQKCQFKNSDNKNLTFNTKFGARDEQKLQKIITDLHMSEKLCENFESLLNRCQHPYGPLLNKIILDTISNSSLPSEKIWWIIDKRWIKWGYNPLLSKYPNFIYVAPVPVTLGEIQTLGISKVNIGNHQLTPKYIRKLKLCNVSINAYVINRLWLFSYYWCLGVDSITTGKCHVFSDNKLTPIGIMSIVKYYTITLGCTLLSLVVFLFMRTNRFNYLCNLRPQDIFRSDQGLYSPRFYPTSKRYNNTEISKIV